jgi:CheY-like chemotaxis protein
VPPQTQTGTPTISSQGHQKVLIVDDDPLISQSIRHLLKLMDLESRVASQWAEAMDALEREKPDLVLLDMRMPNVDGPTLLEFIRESGYDVPVVVVSASLGEVDLDRLRELGVKRFVPKPFSIEQLRGIIEEQLEIASKESATESAASEDPDHKEEHEAVSVSTSKSVPGGRWKAKAGIRRARKQQLVMVALICVGLSLFLLGAKLFISGSGIMGYISDSLIQQSEMKH